MRNTDHYRKVPKGFLDGFIKGFGCVGDLGSVETVPRVYPKDAMWRDMERIGADMYNAIGIVEEEIQKNQKKTLQMMKSNKKMVEEGQNTSDKLAKSNSTDKGITNSPIDTEESLPKSQENLSEIARTSILEGRRSQFSGFIPPPQMLKEYDNIQQGTAERIISQHENEQSHRINWENNILKSAVQEARRGQIFGFIVALTCIASATYLASKGQPFTAAILASVSAIGLVGHFVNRLRRNKD